MDSDNKDKTEELLDRVASHLRATPPPPVPSDLLEASADQLPTVKPKPPQRTFRLAALGLTAAAAVLVVVWIAFQFRSGGVKPETVKNQRPLPPDVETVTTPLSDLQPYAGLEQKLDSMTEEIATLRQQAKLLDAYRKVNDLLAQGNGPTP